MRAIFLGCAGVLGPLADDLLTAIDSPSRKRPKNANATPIHQRIQSSAVRGLNLLLDEFQSERVSVIAYGIWAQRIRWVETLRAAGVRANDFRATTFIENISPASEINLHLMANRQIRDFVILASEEADFQRIDANFDHVFHCKRDLGFCEGSVNAAAKILRSQFPKAGLLAEAE